MAGAALATIIGQIVSAALAVRYLMHYKTVAITRQHLHPRKDCVCRIAALGAAPKYCWFGGVLALAIYGFTGHSVIL